jgi:hypothetical protein
MENLGTTNPKSLWSGNEKVVGILFAILLTFGIGVVLWYVLPPAIIILQNLIYFLVLLGGLTLTLTIIWSNRSMIMLRYQMFIKKLWRAIVNSDPITVMQIQYDKWVRARNKLNENIILMQSAETELKNVMNSNEEEANSAFGRAKKAQEMSQTKDDPEYQRKAVKDATIAKRRIDSNKNFIARLKAIQTALAYCKKLYDHWGDDLEMLKDDINLKKRDLDIASKTASALDAAKSIYNGDPNERALMEMA